MSSRTAPFFRLAAASSTEREHCKYFTLSTSAEPLKNRDPLHVCTSIFAGLRSELRCGEAIAAEATEAAVVAATIAAAEGAEGVEAGNAAVAAQAAAEEAEAGNVAAPVAVEAEEEAEVGNVAAAEAAVEEEAEAEEEVEVEDAEAFTRLPENKPSFSMPCKQRHRVHAPTTSTTGLAMGVLGPALVPRASLVMLALPAACPTTCSAFSTASPPLPRALEEEEEEARASASAGPMAMDTDTGTGTGRLEAEGVAFRSRTRRSAPCGTASGSRWRAARERRASLGTTSSCCKR